MSLCIPSRQKTGLQKKLPCQKDTKDLQDALDILEQEVGSGLPTETSEVPVAPLPPLAGKSAKRELASERSGKAEMGDTMQFWSTWQSSEALSRRMPAWHSADSPERALLAKLEGESPRKPVQPKTWAEYAKAEASANMAEGRDVPVSGAALDTEVVHFSRHRLRRMIQAGQRERVRQEMRASLNLPQINVSKVRKDHELPKLDRSPGRRIISPSKSKSKTKSLDQSTVQFALKRLGKQRGELQQVRRRLEQVVDGDKLARAASKMDDVLRKSIKERRSVLVLQNADDDDEEYYQY